MSLTLVGSVLSPFVRKVRVFLHEKSIEYAHEDLIPMLAPDAFSRISPLGRIPVLRDSSVDDAWALPDSTAICGYLEKKHPEPSLYPQLPSDFGQVMWIEEYADTEFSNCIGQKIFGPLVVQTLLGSEPDKATPRRAFEKVLPGYLEYLESLLNDQDYFVAGCFSIADISVAVHFHNLKHAGFELDPTTYPGLSAFVDRVLARKSFTDCFRDEARFLREQGFTAPDPDD